MYMWDTEQTPSDGVKKWMEDSSKSSPTCMFPPGNCYVGAHGCNSVALMRLNEMLFV